MKRFLFPVFTVTFLFLYYFAANDSVSGREDVSLIMDRVMHAEFSGERFVSSNLTVFGDKNNEGKISIVRSFSDFAEIQALVFFKDDELFLSFLSADYGRSLKKISSDGDVSEIAFSEIDLYPAGFPYTYEDLFFLDFKNDYSAAFLFEDEHDSVECNVISLRPLSPYSRYSRIVIWTGVEDNLIRRADYYSKTHSTRAKSMSAVKVEEKNDVVFRAIEEWTDFVDDNRALIEITEFKMGRSGKEKKPDEINDDR